MLAEEKLGEYEAKLKDHLFLNGNLPGKIDAEILEACQKDKFVPCQCKYPNFWAWYSLVVLYEQSIVDSWKKVEEKKPEEKKGGKKQEKKKEKKEEKTEDDDFDPFAEETEEDKANLEKMKEKNKDDKKKKKKKEEIAKSLILLEIKGFESDQDLDALAKKVINEVKRDGLVWKTEYKLQEVAFGIKKILIGVVVEDEKVSIDDVVDEITGWEDEVQSVEIVAFNKL